MTRSTLGSDFLFVLCQHGAERALERDLARTQPELQPAYRRAGLVTFRAPAPRSPDVAVRSPLARAWGLSLGTCRDLDALCARIEELPAPARLHVSERERFSHTRTPRAHVAGAAKDRLDAALRARMPERFAAGCQAQPGELVVDVVVGKDDWSEPPLLGVHTHDAQRSPHPGGLYPCELPACAPSRAYAKIEEAIAAFELPVRAGDVALELGSAPGGAAYALLRRGVTVIGVDPGVMEPRVFELRGPSGARLFHLQVPMGAVDLRALCARHPRIDWLLLDVHLAPQVALRQVSRFLSHLRPTLLGAVLTLKLNDWAFVDHLDRFEREVRGLGIEDLRSRQLPAHRKELAIAGTTKRGRERSARGGSKSSYHLDPAARGS